MSAIAGDTYVPREEYGGVWRNGRVAEVLERVRRCVEEWEGRGGSGRSAGGMWRNGRVPKMLGRVRESVEEWEGCGGVQPLRKRGAQIV
eukprot:1330997-Pyramimonas_sp.AAC.1